MSSTINRRVFLGSGTAAAASIFIPGIVPWTGGQDSRAAGMTAPVQTAAGRVRGLIRYGVNQFYGVPYAASTAGANRFMPPVKVAPWTGVKDCLQVGERSPQDEDGPISEVFSLDRREPMGEDCLKVNVYTPGLGNGRRPVMVWLHGGGFSGGSGNWLLYDGTNLARKEDVVVVGVNHRLNLLGSCTLRSLGRRSGRIRATSVCRTLSQCSPGSKKTSLRLAGIRTTSPSSANPVVVEKCPRS